MANSKAYSDLKSVELALEQEERSGIKKNVNFIWEKNEGTFRSDNVAHTHAYIAHPFAFCLKSFWFPDLFSSHFPCRNLLLSLFLYLLGCALTIFSNTENICTKCKSGLANSSWHIDFSIGYVLAVSVFLVALNRIQSVWLIVDFLYTQHFLSFNSCETSTLADRVDGRERLKECAPNDDAKKVQSSLSLAHIGTIQQRTKRKKKKEQKKIFRFQNRYIKMARTTTTASTNGRKVGNKFYLCIWFNVAEKVLRAQKQMAFFTIFALNYIFFEIFFVDFSFRFLLLIFLSLCCNSSAWLKEERAKSVWLYHNKSHRMLWRSNELRRGKKTRTYKHKRSNELIKWLPNRFYSHVLFHIVTAAAAAAAAVRSFNCCCCRWHPVNSGQMAITVDIVENLCN